MYWQVYLHKTVLSSENMLINILKRAKELMINGENIFSTKSLKIFLNKKFILSEFKNDKSVLENFSQLDDHDIYACLKEWRKEKDFILSNLSGRILDRKPLKIKIQNTPFTNDEIKNEREKAMKHLNISEDEVKFFVFSHKVSNNTYQIGKAKINILMKDGLIQDITDASDQFNIDALSKTVNKYFLCYPKFVY